MLQRILTVVFLCGLLSACVTAPRVTNTWRAADFNGPAVHRVLVVGVGVDGASRRSFEDTLAQRLQDWGADAVASYGAGVDASSDAAAVERVSQQGKFDAVLETRVLSAGYTAVGRSGPVFMPGFGFGNHGSYAGASIVFGPPDTYDVGATVETSLFRAPGRHMLWSLTTEDYYTADPKRSNAGLADVIAKSLRKQGLI